MYKFIVGFETGLALWGLVVLCSGVAPRMRKPWIRGLRARAIGGIAILPRPLAFGLGYLWGQLGRTAGWQFTLDEWQIQALVVESGLLVLALGTILLPQFLVVSSGGN